MRRHHRVHGAHQQAMALQLAQLFGQHALADARQQPLQLIKALRALQQMKHDHAFPLAADHIQRHFHRATGKHLLRLCHGVVTFRYV